MRSNNKKIVITGADGYIGSNLKSFLEHKGLEIYSITKGGSKREKFHQADITDKQSIFELLNKINPDVIIHTAGMSSLAQCEKEKELAWKVNVEGTRNIIESIKEINPQIKFIFISSDYIFSGKRGRYTEADEPDPATYYGKTKLESEKDIKQNLENYIICRTANVFGRGGNFFNFIQDNLSRNEQIEVFDDTFYTPTYIDYLLDSLDRLIDLDFKGTIHVTGRERVSRHAFALSMAKTMNKSAKVVNGSAQPKGGLIAKDSSLNGESAQKLLKNFCPNIEKSLQYCLGSLIYPYFYFEDTRGRILGLFQDMNWEEVNYIESLKDQIRGNHYHKETKEAFFIIEGKIRVVLEDLSGAIPKKEFIAEKGDIFMINYNILHTFEIIEDSKWINMLSKSIKGDDKDIHKREKFS
jgi:dTDP-4-dehydrorhamnose reductase